MTCRIVLERLSSCVYATSRLPQAVDRHLAQCDRCEREYRLMKNEAAFYPRYLEEVRPSARLWPNIHAELAVRSARASSFRINVAASATAVLMISMIAYQYVSRITGVEDPHYQGTSVSSSSRTDPAAEAQTEIVVIRNLKNTKRRVQKRDATPRRREIVQNVEMQYETAISTLTRDVRQRRSEFSEQALAKVFDELPELDSAIDRSRRAVRAQPLDPGAVSDMNDAYSRKITLLRSLLGK